MMISDSVSNNAFNSEIMVPHSDRVLSSAKLLRDTIITKKNRPFIDRL